MFELWMKRGLTWRCLRESDSEEALRLDMKKRAKQLRAQWPPHRTEFAVRKVGCGPIGDEEPDEVVERWPSL